MKRLSNLMYILVLITIAVYLVVIVNNLGIMATRINALEKTVQSQREELINQNLVINKGIYALTLQMDELKGNRQSEAPIIEEQSINRGGARSQPITMRVTAYDLSYASCKKYPNHPEYGITASGVRVKEWHTIAAGPEIPFNTKVFIPYFQDKPNKGIFTVEDRGSAITENCLDVYMTSNDDCNDFGLQYLEVFILGGGQDE